MAQTEFNAAVDRWAFRKMRAELEDGWETRKRNGKNLYSIQVVVEAMRPEQ